MNDESAEPRRPLTLDDLAALHAVSDPQISPNGHRIAFVVETIDLAANEARSRIWLIDAADGAAAVGVTIGERQDSQPRWSPDGKTLAFVSNRRGPRQIWLLPLAGGEARQLTNHPSGAREPVWSPDGARLAFIASGPDRRDDPLEAPERDDRRRVIPVRTHRHKLDGRGYFGPGREHVWMIEVATGAMTQVTDGPYDDADPAWSPSEPTETPRLAFASNRAPEHDSRYGGNAIHVVDVRTGEVRQVSREGRRGAHPCWSPDGNWIAYPGSLSPDDAAPATTRLWVERADGSGARCLSADLPGSVGHRPGGYLAPSPPAWTADGDLLYLLGDGPSTHLARFGGSAPAVLTSGRRVVSAFSADAVGRRAALLVSDPTTPAEVWLWDEDGARPLTRFNQPLLDAVALVSPVDLRITRPDGTAVEGWLLRPARASDQPLPLVLSVHGGPHNYFGDAFSFDHQLFAALGYAVVYANPRGSGGGTEAFARAVLEDWGGEDYRDLMAMLDHAIGRADPPIDTARLGIFGHSYGGYMACWAVTQTDRFAGAIAGACISNLVSFFGTSDIGASWGEREFGGTPFERLDWYLERSPLTYARRVTTPLLLYHGEADLRCPIEQSEQMFSALHRFEKPVELLRIPVEPHGVLNGSPVHRVETRRAILDWLARYV